VYVSLIVSVHDVVCSRSKCSSPRALSCIVFAHVKLSSGASLWVSAPDFRSWFPLFLILILGNFCLLLDVGCGCG